MNHKKMGVIISIKDKVNFKTGILPWRKEYFVMIKESIHQEDRTDNPKFVGLNNSASKYIKQKLTTESKLESPQLYLDVSTLLSW